MRSALDNSRPQADNRDYYFDAGRLVFTAAYLLKRGTCCGSGCRHCPYGNQASGPNHQATPSAKLVQ